MFSQSESKLVFTPALLGLVDQSVNTVRNLLCQINHQTFVRLKQVVSVRRLIRRAELRKLKSASTVHRNVATHFRKVAAPLKSKTNSFGTTTSSIFSNTRPMMIQRFFVVHFPYCRTFLTNNIRLR